MITVADRIRPFAGETETKQQQIKKIIGENQRSWTYEWIQLTGPLNPGSKCTTSVAIARRVPVSTAGAPTLGRNNNNRYRPHRRQLVKGRLAADQ